jgi:hypothetical protein
MTSEILYAMVLTPWEACSDSYRSMSTLPKEVPAPVVSIVWSMRCARGNALDRATYLTVPIRVRASQMSATKAWLDPSATRTKRLLGVRDRATCKLPLLVIGQEHSIALGGIVKSYWRSFWQQSCARSPFVLLALQAYERLVKLGPSNRRRRSDIMGRPRKLSLFALNA